MGRESAIVTRILQLSEKIGSAELMFTNDCSVGELLSDDPFAFLLAASIDRGMVAETAWRLPGKIRTSIGHLDPSRIASMSVEEMLNVLSKIDGRPRYLGAAAQTLIEVSKYVTDQCAGDARKLWRNQSAKVISRRLTGIYGIGPGISAMVLNLLNRAGEINFSPEDLAGMDPKPDVHLRRVFARLGLCQREPSEADIIDAARRLNPAYPGLLDGPAWHVGRTWCHAQEPACSKCPLGDLCPKLL